MKNLTYFPQTKLHSVIAQFVFSLLLLKPIWIPDYFPIIEIAFWSQFISQLQKEVFVSICPQVAWHTLHLQFVNSVTWRILMVNNARSPSLSPIGCSAITLLYWFFRFICLSFLYLHFGYILISVTITIFLCCFIFCLITNLL